MNKTIWLPSVKEARMLANISIEMKSIELTPSDSGQKSLRVSILIIIFPKQK